MREPKAQTVAWQQLALGDAASIHERAMTRTKVADEDHALAQLKAAVPPAQPTVVDPNAHLGATAQFTRELVDDDLATRGQRILANQFDFHGRRGRPEAGCKCWRDRL